MIVFIILLILLFVLFLKSGEKTVKKALESDRIFLPFDDSIHQTPPQQDRIKRAVEQAHSLSEYPIRELAHHHFCLY